MKERPILFSAPMVRALLAGTKTQTRRIVKPQPHGSTGGVIVGQPAVGGSVAHWYDKDGRGVMSNEAMVHCPYGAVGDRLWVREAWQEVHPLQVAAGRYSREGRAGIPGPPPVDYRVIYRADGEYPAIHHDHPDGTHVAEHPYRALCIGSECRLALSHHAEGRRPGYWTPSIHMPRWASRLTLEITSVRVERLQDISEADAIAEGVRGNASGPYGCEGLIEDYADLWESINGPGSWDANPWVWVVEFKRTP